MNAGAPLARRSDGVRGARGRRARDGRGEHGLLPGPARHAPAVPWLTRPAFGPTRFFYYNLFESDVTGAPLAVRTRARGSVDEYASGRRPLARHAGRLRLPRLLPPRLRLRLARGGARGGATPPSRTPTARSRRCSRPPAAPDEFLERYAVLLCSDHGQTRVERAVRLQDSFAGYRSSGRATAVGGARRHGVEPRGMVYRLPGCRSRSASWPSDSTGRARCRALPSRTATSSRARRGRAPLRPNAERVGHERRRQVLLEPDALERAWAALGNPNAGELRRLRRRRASSSPISAAATTSAAEATARSSWATRRCRCSRSGWARRRPGSST